MKKKELTPKQLSAVPCPTCGVAAGESCVLHSGGARSEAHVERKLSAIEALQKKSR
ncbi:MAG: zinc finger domain-containing protein [Candidatus Acidiferrales bacterium]